MSTPNEPPRSGNALAAGTRLGEFDLTRVIGEGGFGIVYLAQDLSLGRPVALKEYMPAALATRGDGLQVLVKSAQHQATFDAGLASFVNEARLLARFDHPSLLKVYRFWQDHGTAYMVMPYYEGMTLQQRLRTLGTTPDEDWLMRIVAALTEALAVLHAEQCYHRDVSPDNVMLLAGTGQPVLLDFGAARRVIGDMTQAFTVILKPGYAPIEQYADMPDMPQGPWTDVYALAAVLHYAITGQAPVAAAIRMVSDTRVPLAATAAGRYSERLLRAIDQAMALRPAERPQSIDAFRHLLGLPPAKTLPRGTLEIGPPPAGSRQSPNAPPEVGFGVAGALRAMGRGLAGLFGRTETTPTAPATGATPATPALPAPPPAVLPAVLPAPVDEARTLIRPFRPEPAPTPPAEPPSGGQTVLLLPGTGLPAMQLVVTACPDARFVGRRYRLDGPRFELGREGADLALPDPEWSRHQALIERGPAGFALRDLGSANGTFVNGRRADPARSEPLLFGARILIGSTALSFVQADDAAMADLAGRVVAGRYQLGACLRQSPKGAVYRAELLGSGIEVAIKLLSPAAAAYPGHREQFEREAAIAKRLRHPHIAALQDYGHAPVDGPDGPVDTAFLCYGLLEGGTLADRLRTEPPPTPPQVLRWVADIASALQHAHAQGVVHGNLKPGAVCFDAGAQVYVSDFSIGEPGAALAQLAGAPAYLAPEQWNRQPAQPASDQFSLAALAYALLAGSPPFDGQEDPRVRERNFRRGPDPVHAEALRNGRAAVPATVSAVLQRALAEAPDARFEAIDRFAAAFAGALQGQGQAGQAAPVFISYHRESSAGWAVLIQRELRERHGIPCFVDTQGRDSAAMFPEKIARAVRECEVFVCLLSSQTLASRWVRHEIQAAHDSGRPMIPVFQESFDRSTDPGDDAGLAALLHYDGVDLLDLRNTHIEHTLADLARLVRGTLGRVPSR